MIVHSEIRLAAEEAKSETVSHAVPRSVTRVIRVQPDRKSRLAFMTESTGLAVEQYKLLRGRLNALHPKGGVLLVTSTAPADGKTLTSINLSWSLAEGGFRTCLVDLDFRAPGVARTLHLPTSDGGAGEVLTGKRNLSQTMWQVGDRPFHVLPISERTDSPSQYYLPDVLGPLLNSLRASYRWVILDLPPAMPMSDVSEVISQADCAIMVIRAGKTTQALVRPSFEVLGKKLVGVVLNSAIIHGSSYYGSYGTRNR
jgi:capsular exopolysaccharide synthesis family protein